MATSYPGALDSFTNPSSTDQMDASAALYHDVQHSNLNDAVEAIEAELGTDPAGAAATVKARLDSLSAANGPMRWGSGEWLSNLISNSNTATTLTGAADTLYLVPVWLPASATLDRISIGVATGAASANCRIGLYAADGSTGRPTGSATDLGEIDASTTGVKTLTVSQAVTGGQVQWVGILNESGAVALTAHTSGRLRSWLGSEDGTSTNSVSFYSQGSATYSSGFPSIGSFIAASGSTPHVMMRRT